MNFCHLPANVTDLGWERLQCLCCSLGTLWLCLIFFRGLIFTSLTPFSPFSLFRPVSPLLCLRSSPTLSWSWSTPDSARPRTPRLLAADIRLSNSDWGTLTCNIIICTGVQQSWDIGSVDVVILRTLKALSYAGKWNFLWNFSFSFFMIQSFKAILWRQLLL